MSFSVSFHLKGGFKVTNSPVDVLKHKDLLGETILNIIGERLPELSTSPQLCLLMRSVLRTQIKQNALAIKEGSIGYTTYCDFNEKGFSSQLISGWIPRTIKLNISLNNESCDFPPCGTIRLIGDVWLIMCPFQLKDWDGAIGSGYRPYNTIEIMVGDKKKKKKSGNNLPSVLMSTGPGLLPVPVQSSSSDITTEEGKVTLRELLREKLTWKK